MARTFVSSAAIGALVLLGTAGLAHAQSAPARKPAVAFGDAGNTARDSYTLDQSQLNARRTLQWDQQAKWGWKLEMSQPVTREMRLKDIEAGAYFKVTPSFRVGGAVGLTDKTAPTPKPSAEQVTPRVRLETTFKF